MLLPLSTAANRLGVTDRQIRYMIKNDRLKATKQGGHWFVAEEDLPVAPERERARAERGAAAQQEVLNAAARHTDPTTGYSVTRIRAFQVVLAAWRSTEDLGAEDATRGRMRDALLALARGYHAFHPRAKANAYTAARELTAEAAALGWMDGRPTAEAAARSLEAEALPAIGGLVRRTDRRDE